MKVIEILLLYGAFATGSDKSLPRAILLAILEVEE